MPLTAQRTHSYRRRCDTSWWHGAAFDGQPMQEVLANRDVGTLFRFLRAKGWSVNALSAATGINENQVRAISNGRQEVKTYDVLVRVAFGLDIPRGMMGLAYNAEV